MEQAQEVLDRYEPAVQKIAKLIRPYATTIDHRAQDRSDYVSLFRITALRAHEKRPDSPGFVWVSLRNAAADSFRKPKRCSFVSLDEVGEDELVDEQDPERLTAARELVNHLRDRLPAHDMQILEAWVDSGSYREAWRLSGQPDRSKVAQRVQAVLERARAVLAGMSIFGPDVGAQPSIHTERNTMRDQLIKEAERLGVPFTHETTEQELRSMIAARNNDLDGLEPLDAAQLPECFGIAWNAAVDPMCQSCPGINHCKVKMANDLLPSLEIEAGRPLSASELAAQMDYVSPESFQIILDYRMQRAQKSKPQQVAQAAQPPAPPPPVAETAPVEESAVKQKQKAAPQAKKPKAPKESKAPKKNGKLPHAEASEVLEAAGAEDPQLAGSASPVAAPAKAPAVASARPAAVQAPVSSPKVKAKVSASGKAKPAVKKAKPKNVSSTSSTRSKAKPPAKPKAKAKAPKKVSARSAPRLEGQVPWGEHTFQARWERERERSPAIAALTPGTKITREFAGVQHGVQCRQGHYLYASRKFPTLYSVVLEITGGKEYPVVRSDGKKAKGKVRRMTNWSAPRFFRLGKS